jgi:hypothetical protein
VGEDGKRTVKRHRAVGPVALVNTRSGIGCDSKERVAFVGKQMVKDSKAEETLAETRVYLK